jgi:hypothetical protein
MPRPTGSDIQNNFTGGFVTQATALNFPPNAMFEQDNIVVSERAIVSRRPGFDYENNFTLNTQTATGNAHSTYYWKNSAGDGTVNFVVQQNGDLLTFYTTTGLSLSAGVSAHTVALSSFQSSGSTADNLAHNECQYSTGLGYLFVVHPYCDPFYVKYNSDGTFSSSIITFSIRDLAGIPEAGVLVDTRSGSLTDEHKYNLYNQGWDGTKISTFFTAASSKYPSNADVWWIFKDDTDTYAPSTTLASNTRGSSPAAKGYFRISPWDTARAATALAQAGITLTLTNVDETSGTLRPSVTEFHAGRVFYAGVNAVGYNSRIYFSKIVQSPADFGLCQSDNDPTSETLFDFLPSDGGVISIPQAGTIFRLISNGPNLVVFAANGVWVISGSTGVGFSATDYQVASVTDERSISGASFVVAQGSISWWNSTGINVLTNDAQKGLSVSSMTDEKIKDFYLDIPTANKRFARGTYNPRTHLIQWVYRSTPQASIDDTYAFDSVLSFNVLIGAFYTWTVPVTNVSLKSIVTLEGSGSLTGTDSIVDNLGNTVVDNNGNPLITYGFSRTTVTTTTKFLVYSGGDFTFAEAFSPLYKDWSKADTGAEDYTSYFTTGYRVRTQGERNFQTNYIFVFTDLADGMNSYTFQALWNYGNSGNSGQWTQRQTISQTITHAETNYDASRRRLKVRGSGTSVQFKFSSVTGLPFNIVGWSTYETSDGAP